MAEPVNRHDLSPREAIGAAAHRLAGFAEGLIEAHNEFGVPHGPFEDLTDPAFHVAARTALLETLPAEHLQRLGLAFSAVAALMVEQTDTQPHIASNPKWALVEQFLRQASAALAPDAAIATDRPDELAPVAMLRRPTPRIVRFDLLARLAGAAGAARLFDAASWVAEIAPTLHGADAESDTVTSPVTGTPSVRS